MAFPLRRGSFSCLDSQAVLVSLVVHSWLTHSRTTKITRNKRRMTRVCSVLPQSWLTADGFQQVTKMVKIMITTMAEEIGKCCSISSRSFCSVLPSIVHLGDSKTSLVQTFTVGHYTGPFYSLVTTMHMYYGKMY